MGIMAALEALSEYALVGLITFSDRIGLYDLTSADKPHVKYTSIASEGASVDLVDIFPLGNFLKEVSPSLFLLRSFKKIGEEKE